MQSRFRLQSAIDESRRFFFGRRCRKSVQTPLLHRGCRLVDFKSLGRSLSLNFDPTMNPLSKRASFDVLCYGLTPASICPLWKRASDIVCCILALPLLAVTTVFVGLLMAIVSPGPIFFKQERVGYLGRKFKLYKFRTMHVFAETASHRDHVAELMRSGIPMKKMDGRRDSRLIPGGWLLRASGLDEVPQIINILRGEMSLVGPRPCIPYEFEQYTTHQRTRFASVPGLTGLWQVSGKNRTTFEEMIRLDIEYAHRISPRLDLKIIMMTIPAVLGQIADVRKDRKRVPVTKAFAAGSRAHRTTAQSVAG
jgi:lipopolysaccharide/colanic/teichoic acid biosynthesis glycosyltransferase